jgi:hypothetical protein
MRRALVLMWVGFVLPFVLTVINGGPDGWLPHVLFHPSLTGASVTVPMVLLAIVLTVATTVTAWVVTRDAPVGPAYHRGVRTVHRWSSLGFTIAVPLLFAAQDSPVTAAQAVVTIVVLLLTGVQMSGRHYLIRWRRRRNRRDRAGSQRSSSAGTTRTGNGRDSSSASLPEARPASA